VTPPAPLQEAAESPAGAPLRRLALEGRPLHGVRVVDGHCHLGPHAGFFQPRPGPSRDAPHRGPRGGRRAGAGGSGRDLGVAAEEPNVYLDLASSVGRFGAFAAVVGLTGPDKLQYGSDMPWMCATHQIGRVLLAPIPESARRRILGGTMAALLGTRC
jgi:hypothetical protein